MKQIKPIIWGVAIIALGLIFGLNALGLFNFNIFFDGWWTLFIIVPSVISLFTEKDKLASLGFIAVGIILLLAAQDVFSYDIAWKVILAVFLVVAGLTIIIRSTFHNKNDQEVEKKVKEAEKDGKTMDSQMAIFSGSDRVYKDETFQGSNLVAIFGGAKLNLKNAKFDKDTVIKAFTLFGGIDIIVPDDVKVKLKSGFIFGGFSDDRKNATEKGKYTIYIDAAGGFGGVTITDKPEK
jgi:predicted membrane protein